MVHGGIDGFSRLPVFLRVANNNCAQTVLEAFKLQKKDMACQKRSEVTRDERIVVL